MATKTKRSIDVHRFATTTPNKVVEISVGYCEGGTSYFSGQSNARAYYMHCTPVEIENWEGSEIKKFLLFHGRKAKLENAKRFSQKRLQILADKAREWAAVKDVAIMRLVNAVLAEENLTLAEQEAAHVDA
jgi:hypothetical protein